MAPDRRISDSSCFSCCSQTIALGNALLFAFSWPNFTKLYHTGHLLLREQPSRILYSQFQLKPTNWGQLCGVCFDKGTVNLKAVYTYEDCDSEAVQVNRREQGQLSEGAVDLWWHSPKSTVGHNEINVSLGRPMDCSSSFKTHFNMCIDK